MKMEVVNQKKNAVMSREEVVLRVEHQGKATPSRESLLKEIAGKLKSKEDLIIIDRIFSSMGKSESEIRVLMYGRKEDIPKGKLEKMKNRMEKKKKAGGEEETEGAKKPTEGKGEKPPEGGKARPAEGEKPTAKAEKKEAEESGKEAGE